MSPCCQVDTIRVLRWIRSFNSNVFDLAEPWQPWLNAKKSALFQRLKKCWYHRRKFRSQASDNMDRWKAEMGRVREEKRREEKRRRKRKSQKKDPGVRKGRKVANHSVFPIIWSSGGSKSRLAKAAGAEPAGQMRDEKLHAIVARSTFASETLWKS